jgi:hypothetical protein
MDPQLKEKTAIVTGRTARIGLAFGRALSEEGDRGHDPLKRFEQGETNHGFGQTSTTYCHRRYRSIGSSWAAQYLARGFDVVATDLPCLELLEVRICD